MANQSVSVSLAAVREELPWIHLIQHDLPTDEMTQEEVAAAIDELFQTDPCFAESEGGSNLESGFSIPDIYASTWDYINEKMPEILGAVVCGQNEDGGWDLQVNVARSSQDIPYTLITENGELLQTEVIEETVSGSVIVENQDSLTMEYPVIGEGEFSATGLFSLSGSTLFFDGRTTGAVSYRYATRYDRITIATQADVDCLLTALYVQASRQLTLVEPAIDESLTDADQGRFCISEQHLETDDTVTCFERVTPARHCRCDWENVSLGESFLREVPCPDHITGCEGSQTTCSPIIGSAVAVEAVDCGISDGIDDPAFYEQKCCEAPKGDLPSCIRFTDVYTGGEGISGGEQQYIDRFPDADVTFRPISPVDGVCGKSIVEQVVDAKNCCDGVAAIVWDATNSAEILSPGSTAVVAVTGGTGVCTWKVRAQGLWLNAGHTVRDGIGGNTVRLYADETFCGSGTVYVTDGCSSDFGYVKSTEGRWVQEDIDCYSVPFSGSVERDFLESTGSPTGSAWCIKDFVAVQYGAAWSIGSFSSDACDAVTCGGWSGNLPVDSYSPVVPTVADLFSHGGEIGPCDNYQYHYTYVCRSDGNGQYKSWDYNWCMKREWVCNAT